MKKLNSKTKLIISLSIIFTAIILDLAAILGLILTPDVTDFTKSENKNIDYVILLGGGIKNDGTLPSTVINRCESAIQLYDFLQTENYQLPPIVVTGGTLHHKKFAEAPAIKEYLSENGIPESLIYTEINALDTIQNLKYSVEVLSSSFSKSDYQILSSNIVIITNFYHLHRAEYLADMLGYKNVMGLAAKTPASRIPYNYSREILCYIKLALRIIFFGKPSIT